MKIPNPLNPTHTYKLSAQMTREKINTNKHPPIENLLQSGESGRSPTNWETGTEVELVL
jgi:hypothetical protein